MKRTGSFVLALQLLAAKLLAHQGCENGEVAWSGECCALCPPGFGARVPCGSNNTICEPCQESVTFSSTASATDPCRPCSTCPRQLPIRDSCTVTRDTLCATGCPRGHYLAPGNGTQPQGTCAPCRVCEEGFGAAQECKPGSDTECQKCPEGFYSEVKSPYEPCLLCRRECGPKEVMIQPCTPLSDTLCMDKELHILKRPEGAPQKDPPRKTAPQEAEGSGAHNASSEFVPSLVDDHPNNIIPVYCSILAAVVVGLLAYVGFKSWTTCQQKHQLAKARMGELASSPEGEKLHGDSGVFLDTHSLQEQHSLNKGPRADARLYSSLAHPLQEGAEQMLEAPTPCGKDWRSLAQHLGYPDETIETIGWGEAPAHTLLSDWSAQEGATLEALCQALAAIQRGDVVDHLNAPLEVSSMV
ncbi:tumor necrosis factor receptor superfamily member 16-like [Notechis scutatus]|uniref:Tumor necrosis factor receptor superfamily member 16-like n=1 Tax=Notechis scutatus TaxID=8663 RepID=A0A6J1VU36_9SAUR|nr:tumor necrosis factor receptor superfamily member 16-like [Notechis scutatus]